MRAGTGCLPERDVTWDPFSVPSCLGRILLSATGIPAEVEHFCSYKRFIPGDRDEIMLTCNTEIRNTAGNSRNSEPHNMKMAAKKSASIVLNQDLPPKKAKALGLKMNISTI